MFDQEDSGMVVAMAVLLGLVSFVIALVIGLGVHVGSNGAAASGTGVVVGLVLGLIVFITTFAIGLGVFISAGGQSTPTRNQVKSTGEPAA